MRVVVQHRSRYHYPRPALLGPQLIRLRPADHTRARIGRSDSPDSSMKTISLRSAAHFF